MDGLIGASSAAVSSRSRPCPQRTSGRTQRCATGSGRSDRPVHAESDACAGAVDAFGHMALGHMAMAERRCLSWIRGRSTPAVLHAEGAGPRGGSLAGVRRVRPAKDRLGREGRSAIGLPQARCPVADLSSAALCLHPSTHPPMLSHLPRAPVTLPCSPFGWRSSWPKEGPRDPDCPHFRDRLLMS